MCSTDRIPEVGSIWRSPAGHLFQILSVDGWRGTGRDLDYRGRILHVGEDCFGFVVPMSQGWELVRRAGEACAPDCALCTWIESTSAEVTSDGADKLQA